MKIGIFALLLLAASTLFGTETALKRVARIQGHVKTSQASPDIDRIIAAHLAGKKAPMTPTLGFLTVPQLINEVRSQFGKGIDQKDPVIRSILAREIMHHDTHEVFFHGQKLRFIIFYATLAALYEELHNTKLPADFMFLRFWHDAVPQKDANAFIEHEEQGDTHKAWSDGHRHLAKKIMSTNYSAFGGVRGGSCSYGYYTGNTNNVDYNLAKLLEPVFNHLKLNPDYISKLVALSDQLKSENGIMNQIFIPKKIVDSCVYISHPGGTPYRNHIPGVDGFDVTKNRYTKISPLLEMYRKHPAKILEFEGIQARIVFTPQMLDPKSGVKVFTYSKLDKEHQQNILGQVQKLCKQAVAELKPKSKL